MTVFLERYSKNVENNRNYNNLANKNTKNIWSNKVQFLNNLVGR